MERKGGREGIENMRGLFTVEHLDQNYNGLLLVVICSLGKYLYIQVLSSILVGFFFFFGKLLPYIFFFQIYSLDRLKAANTPSSI